MIWIALLLGAFLLGSVPVGYMVGRARGIDIRTIGSGNIGATNVKRALGWKPALAVLAVDVLKGLLPSLAALSLIEPPSFISERPVWAFLVGVFAILGHCFSPWLGFKGGKGIATGLGVLLGSSTLVALCAAGVFVLVLMLCRYVSLSSMIATASLFLWGLLLRDPQPLIIAYALLTLFVVFRHRSNIVNLLKGTERRFSFSRSQEPENLDSTLEEPGSPTAPAAGAPSQPTADRSTP